MTTTNKTTRARGMKVWGERCLERFPAEGEERRLVRTLVRASSKKRAVELLSDAGFAVTLGSFNVNWTRSAIANELEAVSEFGEGVWQEASGRGTETTFKNLA